MYKRQVKFLKIVLLQFFNEIRNINSTIENNYTTISYIHCNLFFMNLSIYGDNIINYTYLKRLYKHFTVLFFCLNMNLSVI